MKGLDHVIVKPVLLTGGNAFKNVNKIREISRDVQLFFTNKF